MGVFLQTVVMTHMLRLWSSRALHSSRAGFAPSSPWASLVLRRSFADDKKNVIDDAFMELLMDAGIDQDDVVADSGAESSPAKTSKEYSALDQTFTGEGASHSNQITEASFRLKNVKRAVSLEKAEELLKDPSTWKDNYRILRHQLDQEPLLDAVTRDQVDSSKEGVDQDSEVEDEALGSLSSAMTQQKMELLVAEIASADDYDPLSPPRAHLSDSTAIRIRREIDNKPEVQREALLRELYGVDNDKEVKSNQSFFEKFTEKLNSEGDQYVKEEDVRITLKKFAEPPLRKWMTDAHGALVGKGYYNEYGKWVQYNQFDAEKDPRSYLHAINNDYILPAYTFRVAGLPESSKRTVKRAYNPPPARTRIPADLVGRYRFGITPKMVEEMELSDKIKRVISYTYASLREIRKARFDDAVEKFGAKANDSGNTAVQLCMLNAKVRHLQEHCAVHRKDQNAKRRLLITISRRRRLYKYLKRRDLSTYYEVLKDQVQEDDFLMHANE